MKVFNLLFCLLFIASAALQYNDPDPYLWIPIYLYGAALCWLAFKSKFYPKAYLAGIFFFSAYAAYLFFTTDGVLDWITRHHAEDIAATMKAEKPWIEDTREFFGLLILLVTLLLNYFYAVKIIAKKRLAITVLALVLHSALPAQQITINFKPVFGSLPLKLNKMYPYKNDSVQLSALKFYISDIQFYKDEKPVNIAVKKHHLVDMENRASLTVKCVAENKQSFNRIQFSIGTDSITNVSGAHGGDLDPTNGMYWTWQSGYINFKLEGKSKICASRNNEFIYHIGGYQHPYPTIQQIILPVKYNSTIVIKVDIAQLLNQLNLAAFFHLMSPGKKAVEMAQKIAAIFKAGA
jgi:Transmembrane family 220, helix